LDVRQLTNAVLSVEVYSVLSLLHLSINKLRALHSPYLFLTSKVAGHGCFVNKPDLLTACDFHWFVSKVYFLEKLRELASWLSSLNWSRSNETIAILRVSSWILVIVFFSASLFTNSEQLGSSFDSTSMHRLVIFGDVCSSWRLALVVANVHTIEAV
jgi:hypothetical protein